ncbi:MAG TPA: hypothetical protein VMW27_09700 [Thermoanaerobaculia bacterium]|nr:hypothetical protein [Thermoanaerobaculia bacterium]
MRKRAKCLLVLLTSLIAFPAFAADPVIYNGIDLWRTVGDGSTFADFSKAPIPAGFFCSKSEPFTGRIAFTGVPLATDIPGGLKEADTIVQRLDDAVFNKRGVALTRLQVRALSFRGLAPIQTACGQFVVKASLDGEQPITRMRIFRENDAGGRFLSSISVNVRIAFTPVGRPGIEPLEIHKSLQFPPLSNNWESLPAQRGTKVQGFLLVDTDGDGTPDTYLPGTSNFGAGQMRRNAKGFCMRPMFCHMSEGCQHCAC